MLYKLSAWSMSYSNKDFLIAKHFEMKEEVSFKMGYDLLFNKIFILFSTLLKKIKLAHVKPSTTFMTLGPKFLTYTVTFYTVK